MATGYTREWIRFFTGCGIPDDVATMYALIFYENRIQKNMLLDLNKEYLKDMGITVMGDVIAILRQAKIIHEKYVREQILQVEEEVIVEQNNSVTESSPGIKKSTPMKRILEHYVRKYDSSENESIGEVQVTLPNETQVQKKIGMQKPLKKKIQINVNEPSLKEKGLEVPVPKVRRVLPENEGGYKIKMPSGTTERSKKLLEQAKKRKKKTVFDRLGESSVSSTTSEISTTTTSTSSLVSREKNPSVFARLGEKTSAVSSTSSIDDSETVPQDQLTYAGILKTPTLKKSLPKTTMRADEQQQSEVGKLKLKKGISVKKRLGVTKAEAQGEEMKRPVAQKKNTLLKASNKFNLSHLGVKKEGISKNFKVETTQTTVTTTTQNQNSGVRSLKRKMDTDSDISPSKKVRFGKTTHRLIPATPSSSEPTSFVKNYPKLTMIINNRTSAPDKGSLSSGMKVGSLNSDKVRDRIGIKDRIGNKSVQGRLGKPTGAVPRRNITKIKDRLG